MVGLVLVGCDIVEAHECKPKSRTWTEHAFGQIFITLSSWLRIFIARRLLEVAEVNLRSSCHVGRGVPHREDEEVAGVCTSLGRLQDDS